MYIGKNGLLQVHRQHLDWHSQDSLKDVAESLQNQLGSSRSHADYICLKQALKALAQPGEPFTYLGRTGLPLLQLRNTAFSQNACCFCFIVFPHQVQFRWLFTEG